MLNRVYVFAGAALALSVSDAVALEYCVTCEGPPAMYRCVIKDTEDGQGKDSSVSLYCISKMAAQGRHQSCAVSRGAPFPCPGLTAVIDRPQNLPTPPPAAVDPHAHAAQDTSPDVTEGAEPAHLPEAEKPEKSEKVPRTVEELAGQTVKSSKENLQKAGEAIGGTAKKAGEQIGSAGSAIGNAASKTWTCITSLFSSCSGNDADAPPDEPATN